MDGNGFPSFIFKNKLLYVFVAVVGRIQNIKSTVDLLSFKSICQLE